MLSLIHSGLVMLKLDDDSLMLCFNLPFIGS